MRVFGRSFPVTVAIIIIIMALLAAGFISGALGQAIIGQTSLSNLFAIEKPVFQILPEIIFNIGPFGVSNTLLATWLNMLVLVLIFWAINRHSKLVPGRSQSALEYVLEWILNFCTEIAGEKNGRRYFPLVTTMFLFILMNTWMNLVPFYRSILVPDINGNPAYLLRGVNTDIYFTLALSLVSFVFVLFHGIKAQKITFFKVWFNFGRFFRGWADFFTGKFKAGFKNIFLGIIDIFTGFLELLSYLFRIISFTFRLFGNMTGGEIIILLMIFLVPWVLALPFYGLELLVGIIQALVFAGLTLVFTTVATTSMEME